MKVFFSIDMEGISGISAWEQVTDGSLYYESARALLIGEANAAVEGAVAGGADEIVVTDAHGSTRNIPLERLHPAAKQVSGVPRPQGMLATLDESFQAALFIGYHAKANSRGVLAHTWSNSNVSVRLNGMEVGETGLNAAIAGHYGVPVVAVTGDDRLAEEVRVLLPDAEVVIVKRALGRFSAESLPHANACALVREGVERAVRRTGKVSPFRLAPPIQVETVFQTPSLADGAVALPGAERVDALTVAWSAPDMLEAFRGFRVMQVLAGGAGK